MLTHAHMFTNTHLCDTHTHTPFSLCAGKAAAGRVQEVGRTPFHLNNRYFPPLALCQAQGYTMLSRQMAFTSITVFWGSCNPVDRTPQWSTGKWGSPALEGPDRRHTLRVGGECTLRLGSAGWIPPGMCKEFMGRERGMQGVGDGGCGCRGGLQPGQAGHGVPGSGTWFSPKEGD